MHITLVDIGKKYNRNWIFSNINYIIQPNSKLALLGANGSGKSTLLQIISGHVVPTKGEIIIKTIHQNIDPLHLYNYISYCAPAFELIEEFTIQEFLEYHFKHKKSKHTVNEILDYISLTSQKNTLIENCSSGMKQRVKLAQAFFSDVPVLLLDEPCTNLDTNGVALYKKMIEELTTEKTVIVSSNDSSEYSFCDAIINLVDYK
jgi:ABC-type multidrug transport system ATPase subunit